MLEAQDYPQQIASYLLTIFYAPMNAHVPNDDAEITHSNLRQLGIFKGVVVAGMVTDWENGVM